MRVPETSQAEDSRRTEWSITIVGSGTFQNELLAYVLTRELKTECRHLDRIDAPRSAGDDGRKSELLFIDCNGKSPKRLTEEINAVSVKDTQILAFYNLRPGLGIEQVMLMKGVKGFFYEYERLALFVKGVRALFNGEVWLSRGVLIECIKSGASRRDSRATGQKGLTKREIDILALVATGFGNDEIAEKLFISTNTVKTHLYNIFGKLNVPNRLQAALWASKNFEKV